MDVLGHRIDGEGEPLLLLNGGMMSIAAWEAIAGPLKKRYRVVRCDFRGQLLSPGGAHADMAGNARDLVVLLDAVGARRAHVVGASFGAEVALHSGAGHALVAEQPRWLVETCLDFLERQHG